jgi:F0F1-type ATP synthase membrane subunit b/b'
MTYPVIVTSITTAGASRLLPVILIAALLGGCSTVYYKTMEKFGYEKRDILVDRVEDARDSQNDAQETFRSSLERFQSVVDTPDTELKEQYAEISDAYEDSLSSAEEVRDRIDKVEEVAEDLFDEWEDELSLYESASLRRSSEQQLKETRVQYSQLISRMHDAEARMEPVLQAFEDQVLYLKHNLNAQAIGSLENELVNIRQDVDSLIRNMEQSIAESEAFIQRFRQGG